MGRNPEYMQVVYVEVLEQFVRLFVQVFLGGCSRATESVSTSLGEKPFVGGTDSVIL